jgi:hypothetical protein
MSLQNNVKKQVLMLDTPDFPSQYLIEILNAQNIRMVEVDMIPYAIGELKSDKANYGAFIVEPYTFYLDPSNAKDLLELMISKRQNGLFVCAYSTESETTISKDFNFCKTMHYDNFVNKTESGSGKKLVDLIQSRF